MTPGETIVSTIANHFHVNEESLSRDVKLDAQLDCNGTDICQLAEKLEDAFDIAISDDEADAWLTVGDVIDFVLGAVK